MTVATAFVAVKMAEHVSRQQDAVFAHQGSLVSTAKMAARQGTTPRTAAKSAPRNAPAGTVTVCSGIANASLDYSDHRVIAHAQR